MAQMMQVEEEEEYHPPAVHLIQQPTVRAQSSNETAQKRKGTKRSAITVTQPEIETVAQMPINSAPTISGRPVQKVTMFPTFPNIIASDISLQTNPTMEVINEVLNDESTAMREVSPVTIHEIQKRLKVPPKPGLFQRAAQLFCGTGKSESDGEDDDKINNPPAKKKKGRGPGKKTIQRNSAKDARQSQIDYNIAETMTEKQQISFNNILSKNAQYRTELENEKKTNAEMAKRLNTSEVKQQKLEEYVKQLELQRETDAQLIAQLQTQNTAYETFKSQSQSQTAELLVKAESSRKTAEKLRGILLSTAASEKKLKRENDEISTQLEAMGRCAKEMEESFEKIGKFVEKELSTSSEASPPTKAFAEPKPPKPLEECSESYKRAKVLETVRSLENEPLLKQGVLKRLATEKKEEDTKFTPLEAVAMSVSVGMNESKLEKLKSFLRLKNMDFLPTVRKMRNEIKNIYNDNKYETLEDKEKGIYCRRAVEVEKFVESRISGALKSNNYEDAPGFEDCSFMAVNLDKGGGQIKFTISACNVKKGKASPNASAIIGVAKAKEDDYETYKFCFKKNFDQINALDGKIMEFNINGQIIRKRIIFLVCCDGKMMSILAGHAGAAASNPCFTCEATKSEINQGIFAPLRTAERTKQQAEDFLKNGSLPQSKSIKNPPLLTIPMDRWIYGSLHCVSGPASAVLKKVEEEALDEDLKNLGITILSNKEERKKAAALQDTIEAIKSEIDDLEKAFKLSKVVLKARKTQQNRHVEPFTGQCQAEYCLKEILGNKSLFNTCIKCSECGNFVHSTCGMILREDDIADCQEIGYGCPACYPCSTEEFLEGFEDTKKEWDELLKERKTELAEAENSKDRIDIPYEKCVNYQLIQQKLKELNIRKAKGFQTLNGVDVRKLVKNGSAFSEAVLAHLQDDVKTVYECLNNYQELARPVLITDEQINNLDTKKLLEAYQKICGNNITPKLHDLTTHTIEFMKKFHFYQWCSDQPIEHIHALANYLLRTQTSARKDEQSQLKAITDHFSLRNMLFDSGLNIGSLKGKSLKEKQDIIENLKK